MFTNNRFFDRYELNGSLKYGFERFNAGIDSENYNQRLLQFSVNKPMYASILQLVGVDEEWRQDWSVSASLSHRKKNHDSGTEIFGLREDRVYSLQLSASKQLQECWVTNFNYRYNKATSTVDLFNIKNKQIGVDYTYICFNN